MVKSLLQTGLLTCLLMGAALGSAHSQRNPVSPTSLSQGGDSIDDTDVDLNNPMIPIKYAHGELTGMLEHYNVPAPKEMTARRRYFQAQDLQSKGVAYLYYNRYDKAISRLNQSLALWSDNAQTYRWLAEAYEDKGETQQAIANYRLLFYGWPGRVRSGKPEQRDDQVPADKPRDYDQATPAETDPTLLMQFSLLLQQTNQFTEAKRAYEHGMQALAAKLPRLPEGTQLPPLSAEGLNPPNDLEAATRTALAIDETTYSNQQDAKTNLDRALQLRPGLAAAQFQLDKIKADR